MEEADAGSAAGPEKPGSRGDRRSKTKAVAAFRRRGVMPYLLNR